MALRLGVAVRINLESRGSGMTRALQGDEQRHAAYHEAAHAVVAVLLRVPFRHVSIIASEGNRARMVPGVVLEACEPRDNPSTRTRLWLERRIMVLLAGPAASSLLGWGQTGASDWAEARAMAKRVCPGDGEAEAFEAWLHERVLAMLREPATWEAVEAVADALQQRGRLGERSIRRLVGRSLRSPRAKARADRSRVELKSAARREDDGG
jgi:hypothetical protein